MSRRTIISLIVLVLVVGAVIWYAVSRKEETPAPALSVSAYNQTQGKSATDSNANPQDLIVYTLTAENQSDKTIPGYIMEANISEITDKASLVDASGAAYNAGTNSLVWTPQDIPAKESINKKFSVRVNPLASGSNSSVMKIKFNNEIAINITPSQPAVSGDIAQNNSPKTAPKSGASEWIPLALAVMATVLYFTFRRYKLIKI